MIRWRRQIRAFIHQLEGRLNPVDALNVVQTFQSVDHQLITFITQDGVDAANRSYNGLNIAAKLRDNGGDFGELLRRETVGFGNDHGKPPSNYGFAPF